MAIAFAPMSKLQSSGQLTPLGLALIGNLLCLGSRGGDTSHDVMVADCGVLSKGAVKSGTTAAMRSFSGPQRPDRQHTLGRQPQWRRSSLYGRPMQQR